MLEVKTDFHRAARIWVSEAPGALGDSPASPLTSMPSAAREIAARSATIEVVIPRGASMQWGLLGAMFEPHPDGSVEVSARITAAVGCDRRLRGSLVEVVEEPCIGLPLDYAVAASRGLSRRLVESGGMSSGVITFDRAAFGEFTSSESHFEFLGSMVADLLTRESESDDAIRMLVGQALASA